MQDMSSPEEAAHSAFSQGYQQDSVTKFLLGVGLAEHEPIFRMTLKTISDRPDEPGIREITIATISLLMTLGQISMPVIMYTVGHLNKRSEEEIKGDAIAIMNGAYIVLPDSERESGNIILSLETMKEVDTRPVSFVSSVYSLAAIWEEAERILES